MKAILRNRHTGSTDTLALMSEDFDDCILECTRLLEEGIIAPEEEVTAIVQ